MKRTSTVALSHLSKSIDLTLLICVPRLLWIPEHSIQIKHPILIEAHCGSMCKEELGESVQPTQS
jgi:hypothetical protein